MFKIAKLEISKLFRSKYYLKLLIPLSLFILIATVIHYFIMLEGTRDINLFSIIYMVFIENGPFFFPIIAAIFFTDVIVNEFKQKTINILFSSTFSREEIFIGKFLGTSVVLTIIFMGLLTISTIFASLVADIRSISIGFFALSYGETLTRILIIAALTLLFLICVGSYVFLFGAITKNQVIPIVCLLLTILFNAIPFLPYDSKINTFIGKYSFINGLYITEIFSTYEIPYIDVLMLTMIFLLHILIFIRVGMYVFKKRQI